jgi:ankyrin repeat protein
MLKMNMVILQCTFHILSSFFFYLLLCLVYVIRHAAASYGEDDLIQFLVSSGANIELTDHDGDTPLLVCENAATYELLIRLGANPNARNNNNEGIIEKILDDENLEMMQYFVEKGMLDEATVQKKLGLTEEDMMNMNMEGIEEGDEDEEEGEEAGDNMEEEADQ